MLFNPGESLFLGGFAIGTATLIDAALIVNQTYQFGGSAFTWILWGFWWFDLVISYTTAFGMIYIMFVNHCPQGALLTILYRILTRHHLIEETTSLWVLPIIALIVASATGGNMSQALLHYSTTLATLTVAFSLVALIIGMSLTLMIITLYLTRLLLRGPPSPQVAVAAFIVASPLGTAGSSLLVNGRTLSLIFPGYLANSTFPRIELAGQILYALCVCGSFTCWSMAFSWLIISTFTVIVVRLRDNIPFRLSFWGAVFPNGVFALCSVELGEVFHSPFFNYFGVVWTGMVISFLK